MATASDSGDDGHAAGRDGPDAPLIRMKKRRWPSADRRRRCTHVDALPNCDDEMPPMRWTRAWTSRQYGWLSHRRRVAGAGRRDIDTDQRQPKRPGISPSV